MQDKKVYTVMVAHALEVHHFWPFGYCQKPYPLTHWRKAKYFTYRCKKWVLQFVIAKVAATLLLYLVYPNDHPQPHDQQQDNLIPADHSFRLLVSSVINWGVAVSASYSLYYLVLFYHVLSRPLAPYSALLKFLTIKITIFFTFWQRVMLGVFRGQLLSCFDQAAPNFSGPEIISSLQNTLICLEMLLMAVAGGYAYSYRNYVTRRGARQGTLRAVVADTLRSFRDDFRLIKPKRFGFEGNGQEQEETELCELGLMARASVSCEIKVKRRAIECVVEDYL